MNRKDLIEIFFYLIIFIHQSFQQESNDKIFLINDQSNIYYLPYTILSSSNHRIKREKIDIDQSKCDQHIYTKLYSCSRLTECSALTSCLESIYCPSNVKSHGSLILNLLHLLDLKNCDWTSSCPNNQRVLILQNLLTYWTDKKFSNEPEENIDNYCQTISEFISEVKQQIQSQCSAFLNQVNSFLENYLCSLNSPVTRPKSQLDWSKLDETLRKISTTSPQVNYFDEDEELNFVNFDRNLVNTTDQSVYVNDHQYYNVSYIVPRFESVPMYFVEDNKQFQSIQALSDKHRSAFSINLKFDFPFYGHSINKILVGTGGFIYTGDLLHSALIGSTQYIAPFMANFDVSIGGNHSQIKYFDNSTHFICTWNHLYLQDQQDAGPFTFQVILQDTGNIYFNYIRVPQVKVSTTHHAHRIGLSDAYMSQHSTNEHIIRVVTLYDKINLDKDKIRNGVSIVFDMDNTCNTFTDCTSCLANRGKRYNCSWCEDIQKCSDGYDRSRQQWIKAQCHRLASEDTCSNRFNEQFFQPRSEYSSSISPLNRFHDIQSDLSSYRHSTLATFRTIVVTLMLTVLILSIVAFFGTYIYAYRNPTSPPGMWLIEHRPSTYIARFKRFTGMNNEST